MWVDELHQGEWINVCHFQHKSRLRVCDAVFNLRAFLFLVWSTAVILATGGV